MAKKKRPSGADIVYANHLRSSGMVPYQNPSTDEVARLELFYIERLREMCVSLYKWNNLPESIDARFVETVLYESGLIVYCRPEDFNPKDHNGTPLVDDPNITDLMLRATPAGYVDYQDNPLAFLVTAMPFYSDTLSRDVCVPVYANADRTTHSAIVRHYARRLAEADRTTDINLKSARHTRIVTVPESQRLTAVNLIRQVDQGEPVVFGGSQLDREAYAALDTGMDFHIIQAVQDARNRIFNECMTALGIDNANQDKKERMVVSEVGANQEQVAKARLAGLRERQRGAARINKMFGTKITVTWNIEEDEDTVDTEEDKENSNGDVHNGTMGDDEKL